MRGLAAHDLAAHDTLGVLHGYSPLTSLDEHDEGHNRDHHHDQQQNRWNGKCAPSLGADFVVEVGNDARQTYYDAGEDQQRHAVADAALGDLFAQPHDEHAACGEREHGHEHKSG